MSEADRDVVVVGASAAGLRCACRLRRLQPDWRVTVVEANPVFSYAACGLPYVLSGDIAGAEALRQTPYGTLRDERFFLEEKGVEVLAGWRATDVDLAGGKLKVAGPRGERLLSWDELVLATGARPRRLPNQAEHPRVRSFHRWEDIEPLKQGLARGEYGHVAVIGAGLVGCEMAEALRALWGAEVTVVEAAAAPLPGVLDSELGACVARHMQDNGIRVQAGSPVDRLTADDSAVRVRVAGQEISADVAIVAVGVEPEVELAKRLGARLGPTGAIAVDERLSTSVPHVWAAGDCAELRDVVTGHPVYRPLGSLANRQGRTLGSILAGHTDTFPPVAGAVAVKVFDFNVAAVGCTSEWAARQGLTARSVWITAEDRADYWPEAQRIHLKLVYEPGSSRVLGVQVAGKGDSIKRVDVATQLITEGATLARFAQLEHAYAPPYAPAVDPLAMAAWAALNQEEGVKAEGPLERLDEVLDVRLQEERERRPAPARHVIEAGLRTIRSGEDVPALDGGLVVCERGTRSAETVRYLRGGDGERARYLGGGLLWRYAAGKGDS